MLRYGEEIQYQKDVEVSEAYIEVLDNYIGAKVVVPGKYSIPFMTKVKHRNRYVSYKPIGEEHRNPIPDTRVYKLKSPYGKADGYAVKIIIESLIGHDYDQGWNTRMLEEIVFFCRDLDVN